MIMKRSKRTNRLLACFILCLAASPAKAECVLAPTAVCQGAPCGGETRAAGTIIHNADWKSLVVCKANGNWESLSPLSDNCEAATSLSDEILSDNPDGYWRLNDTGGTAVNLGSGGSGINGSYQNGVEQGAPELYTLSSEPSSRFDGANDRINIPDSSLINTSSVTERTVSLVFNADTVTGRQILWEEGANVNALNIYIDDGQLYFHVRDRNDFQVFVPTPVQVGTSYHVALVFDQPENQLVGYVNGQNVGTATGINRSLSPHSGNIGIGGLNDASHMHDGNSPNNTFFFDGRISDVALYNRALSAQDIQRHAEGFLSLCD